ncbi:MAG: pcrA [Cyanobacteria bacterium RYN_339]|nr:pcrA [Cyanobacteria bacterium RYN_339]
MTQLSLLAGTAANPLLHGLNEAQRLAVQTIDGPVLVVAAPGSGKTTVLTNRVAHMLQSGIAPERVMAVTFTKKAATEMQDRIAKKVGGKALAEKITIGTFHSICLRLLDGHYKLLGYPTEKQPHLVMPGVQRAIFELLLRENHMEDVRFDDLAAFISRAKSMLVFPAAIKRQSADPAEVRYAHLYGAYQSRLEKQNLIDFDDQLCLAVRLLAEQPAIAADVRKRYTHILVDEYQDTNRAQYELLKLLASPRNNLFAVGDDAQGIYGFRAADLNNILNFKKDYQGTKDILLETNYRSTPQIVALANNLISHNSHQIDKTIRAANASDPKSVLTVQFQDNFAEADQIGERILEHIRNGVNPEEIANLYRTHAQAIPFMDALSTREIPFTVKKSDSFYERLEIAETLAYMRLAQRGRHPLVELALEKLLGKLGLAREALAMLKVEAERQETDLMSVCWQVDQVPLPTLAQKGLVKHVLNMIRGWQNWQGPIADLYKAVLDQTHYRQKLEKKKGEDNSQKMDCLGAMYEQIKRWEPKDVRELFQRIDQATKPHKKDKRTGAVQLLTIHGSKGLEWDAVFVIGLEEGVLPYQVALDEGELAEERRLCYVAITRARKHLQLSYGRERSTFGKAKDATPSRFMNEMTNKATST